MPPSQFDKFGILFQSRQLGNISTAELDAMLAEAQRRMLPALSAIIALVLKVRRISETHSLLTDERWMPLSIPGQPELPLNVAQQSGHPADEVDHWECANIIWPVLTGVQAKKCGQMNHGSRTHCGACGARKGGHDAH